MAATPKKQPKAKPNPEFIKDGVDEVSPSAPAEEPRPGVYWNGERYVAPGEK